MLRLDLGHALVVGLPERLEGLHYVVGGDLCLQSAIH